MTDRLNSLLTTWPRGVVATSSWLQAQGISKQLTSKYVRSGWLSSIGHGAAIRAGDKVTWSGGLLALQQQLQLPVWLGGPSLLNLRGYAHYLPLGRERIWLYGQPGTVLPKWFRDHDWGVDVELQVPQLLVEPYSTSLETRPVDGLDVQVSTLEQAVLELLYLVPLQIAFEAAAEMLMGLSTLHPERMQGLLEACRLIRIRRLFLFLADYYQLPVLEALDLDRIDLGSGTRQIVAGGRLDRRFRITVPEAFAHVR